MLISLDHLGKDFRKKPRALDDLTLDLPSGMIGLVGPNGAGKTTLMRILCGIASPTRGRVLVDGCDLADARVRRALKRTLGYLPQDIEPYPNLTPPEFLDYVGVLKGMDDARERRRQAAELLERVGLGRCGSAAYRRVFRRKTWAPARGHRPGADGRPAAVGGGRTYGRARPRGAHALPARFWPRSAASARWSCLTDILDDVAQTCPYVCVLRGGHVRYDGATADLVGEARGRTWLTPPLAAPPAQGAAVNAASSPEGTRYRLVADVPPAGSQLVEPALEDGYMALASTSR